ncbi:dihydrofolate reductase family protein [Flagellimonas amoyensis]|uniref:dihydrofolate reductase family protein n=1 Tax=Flagellimonas amoyensis TaxID=2169401 RepID=UPI000D3B0D71|nr:dihydrofolate reductase family protein [Allomuricauda amoyensis]
MRQINVLEFISLDGVIQAPGAKDEDRSGGFEFGGWVAPFGDEVFGKIIQRQMEPSDLLLGRKTFDIWEKHWPHNADHWPKINEVKKYVLSNTRTNSEWSNSIFLNDIEDIKNLKKTDGTDIKVWGSSELVQLLFKNDLVDGLWLKIFPITLGQGKKLFGNGVMPATFKLMESTITPSGIIVANYKKEGDVRTGNIGEK